MTALGRLDRYLRERASSDRDADPADDRVADVYLGYGLSASLRRTDRPAPPEPARLPVLACRRSARGAGTSPDLPAPFRVGRWEPTWTRPQHAARHRAGTRRDRGGRGLPGQPRPAPRWRRSWAIPLGWSGGWRPCDRSIGRPMAGDGWAIVSASPELFLSRRGDMLTTMPIKGTRPAGAVPTSCGRPPRTPRST